MFIRCPTCGTVLANKIILFINEMEKKYGKEKDWSSENYEFDNSEIIKKIGLDPKRYCCTTHLLCWVFKETLDQK